MRNREVIGMIGTFLSIGFGIASLYKTCNPRKEKKLDFNVPSLSKEQIDSFKLWHKNIINTIANSQKPDSVVEAKFTTVYPNAKFVKWKEMEDNWEVSFIEKGDSVIILYPKNKSN